jgi:RNA polymerase sigma-70 factor (ECF subfamily)
MLANVADAEDITQDVLLQVVCNLATFRGESCVSTWLYRITVNTVLLHQRKRAYCKEQRVTDPLEAFGADGCHGAPVRPWSVAPDEVILSEELRRVLEKAIDGLPPRYREVFVRGDVEGLSNVAIGTCLGLSLAAVKSRLHRARLMMRNALAHYFEEVRP